MTKEQYNLWRNDPVTLFFRQFLREFSEALIRSNVEGWLNNSEAFERDRQGERMRIVTIKEMAELEYEAIENFYKERENGTEADTDSPR